MGLGFRRLPLTWCESSASHLWLCLRSIASGRCQSDEFIDSLRGNPLYMTGILPGHWEGILQHFHVWCQPWVKQKLRACNCKIAGQRNLLNNESLWLPFPSWQVILSLEFPKATETLPYNIDAMREHLQERDLTQRCAGNTFIIHLQLCLL